MTLKGFLIILIFLTICAIAVFFISKKYPPKIPEILITFTPAKRIDLKLVDLESYRFEDVRYIRDEKYLKIYPEENIEMIFPLDVIISIRIVKGGSGE